MISNVCSFEQPQNEEEIKGVIFSNASKLCEEGISQGLVYVMVYSKENHYDQIKSAEICSLPALEKSEKGEIPTFQIKMFSPEKAEVSFEYTIATYASASRIMEEPGYLEDFFNKSLTDPRIGDLPSENIIVETGVVDKFDAISL